MAASGRSGVGGCDVTCIRSIIQTTRTSPQATRLLRPLRPHLQEPQTSPRPPQTSLGHLRPASASDPYSDIASRALRHPSVPRPLPPGHSTSLPGHLEPHFQATSDLSQATSDLLPGHLGQSPPGHLRQSPPGHRGLNAAPKK
ncbi:hypothetical protein AVEN_87386-1 [Araneus ventricosus]|uniref:Uncharacterized protein n=1 Tax=Araneus ventricosus TaxID=182803 RepID=A0A4Y2IFA5_ARAVE|nr:hypothetical protein AVEN_87386-1 [Araneus ventricosus]